MYNKQRTPVPNQFLAIIGFISTSLVLGCLVYSYLLLQELNTDTVNPIEVCKKINSLKTPEYSAHVILSATLVLRGWWIVGILNFPFIFYNFSQWYEGKHILESTKVFSILSQELRIIKAKASFFILIILYYLWEWIGWVPPKYVKMGKGYNVMKNIQVSH
mmetsp:Transcript_19937/g.48323  ORF Transcript_19937/g.48323 Transcript_19937/m.48323 type:complete len:161 (-) Transcript_19937:3535-4017(-)